MCIAAIIHKPIPHSYLRSMDHDNPHGGGVAWLENGQLHFRRGLDADMIFALQETRLTYPYLLHFRWATHGAPVAELTHPFPTGPRAFKGELQGTADEVLIHNGVWRDYDDWAKWLPTELYDAHYPTTSDTAVAAYFYQLIPDLGDEIPWAVASARVGDDGALKIRKHGGWSEHKGNEYSNLMWLPYSEWPAPKRGWGYHGASGGWVWEDDTDTSALPDYRDSSWDEYIRTRYGAEVAAAVSETDPATDDDAELMAKLAEAESEREWAEEMGLLEDKLPDDDMISDDPNTVNRWLAAKSAREFLKKGA